MPYERNADEADLPHTEWKCEQCGAMNSCIDGECQFCSGEPEIPEPQFYTVAVYFVDKQYGGPEEGGWYYTSGERIDVSSEFEIDSFIPKTFKTWEEALSYQNDVNAILDQGVNKGRRSISSVLSTGRYQAEAREGYPPKNYPEIRPHYE